MDNKIELIDKSIDEGYLLSTIEQSKEGIMSIIVSDQYRLEMKKKLLSCIEDCSGEDFNNIVTVNEILHLLSNNLLLDRLTDEEKTKLYVSLGDNYFLLGQIEESLDSFHKAYELGDNNILKEIIYINLFNNFSKIDGDIDFNRDPMLSFLINDIIDNKDKVYYLNALENDLEEFFIGGEGYLKDAEMISEHIYNLEVAEELGNISLDNILINGDKKLYNHEKEQLEEKLSNGYLELYKESGDYEGILFLRENMIKRFSGETIDYSEYTLYLKQFLATGFDMIEMYFKIGETDKAFSILNIIMQLGFSNLGQPAIGYIIENIKGLVGGYNDLDNKGFTLNIKDYDRLNYILLEKVNLGMPSYETMLDIGDIFLIIGFERYALNAYLAGSIGTNKYILKLIDLLEKTLLEKDFSEIDNLSNKTNPELIISLLLEKLNNNKILNNNDLNNVQYVLSL